MTELLQSYDVMDVLPDHPRDGHRTHEAHNYDALAFHRKCGVDGDAPHESMAAV
jgi:hypothetical protein